MTLTILLGLDRKGRYHFLYILQYHRACDFRSKSN